jgi:hypothetical protein
LIPVLQDWLIGQLADPLPDGLPDVTQGLGWISDSVRNERGNH